MHEFRIKNDANFKINNYACEYPGSRNLALNMKSEGSLFGNSQTHFGLKYVTDGEFPMVKNEIWGTQVWHAGSEEHAYVQITLNRKYAIKTMFFQPRYSRTPI